MMTSRSEYRLVLRQDNAPERLLPIGHSIGLISEERYNNFLNDRKLLENEMERIKRVTIHPTDEVNRMLIEKGTTPIDFGIRLYELLKRPQLAYSDFAKFDSERPALKISLINRLEIELKYSGYIKIQLENIEKTRKLEQKKLPAEADYTQIKGLRLEAQEKLNKHKPLNIGQASRISGVNPADISVLLIWLAGKGDNK